MFRGDEPGPIGVDGGQGFQSALVDRDTPGARADPSHQRPQPRHRQLGEIDGDHESPALGVDGLRPSDPGLDSGQRPEIGESIPQEGDVVGGDRQCGAVFGPGGDGDAVQAGPAEQVELAQQQGLSVDLQPGLVTPHAAGAASGENQAAEDWGAEAWTAGDWTGERGRTIRWGWGVDHGIEGFPSVNACHLLDEGGGSDRGSGVSAGLNAEAPCPGPGSRVFLPPMSQLDTQVAVVTGAGRGIGRAIALRFAQAGADVVVVSRTVENSEKTAAEIRALGRKAWALAVDVSDPAAIAAAAETVLEQAGRVDILVNNAGVTKDGLLMRMSESDWDTVLNTNLRGAFLFTKALTRTFLKQRSGRIINLASVIGLIGNAGQANYAASKAGLIGFTKSVAKEFGSRGVTCNAIAPGFIETDMTAALNEAQKEAILKQIPLGSLGQASDIAEAALYLAGPGGRYITGQVLTVDGGMVM